MTICKALTGSAVKGLRVSLVHRVKKVPAHVQALPSHPLDNIQVMVIVWSLSGNTVRTALCRIV